MIKPSYYEYFGLKNFEEDQDKIKRAHRSMALKHHPDRGGSVEDMQTVNEVYRVLSKQKEEYDRHLRIKLGIISPDVKRSSVTIIFGNNSTCGFNFYESY